MPKTLGKTIPPTMTDVSRDAISTPSLNEIIYNTDIGGFQFWDGVQWNDFFTEGAVIEIPPSTIGGGASSMVVTFASGGTKHVSSTSPTYESLGHVIYGGSDNVGDIIRFNINTWLTNAGTGNVRFVDLSNGNIIVELIGITSQDEFNVQSMGAITNIPTIPTVFELQAEKGGGGATIYIGSLEMNY